MLYRIGSHLGFQISTKIKSFVEDHLRIILIPHNNQIDLVVSDKKISEVSANQTNTIGTSGHLEFESQQKSQILVRFNQY